MTAKFLITILIAFLFLIPSKTLAKVGIGVGWEGGTQTGFQGVNLILNAYKIWIEGGYVFTPKRDELSWYVNNILRGSINYNFLEQKPKRLIPSAGFSYTYATEKVTDKGREVIGENSSGNLQAYSFFGGVKFFFSKYFGIKSDIGYSIWDTSNELDERYTGNEIKTPSVYFQAAIFLNIPVERDKRLSPSKFKRKPQVATNKKVRENADRVYKLYINRKFLLGEARAISLKLSLFGIENKIVKRKDGGYTIFAGVFKELSDAKKVRHKILDVGYRASIYPTVKD